MKIFFDLKYIPWVMFFALTIGYVFSIRVSFPWMVISVPTMICSIYLIGLTYFQLKKKKRFLFSNGLKYEYIFIILIYVYMAYSLVKYVLYSSQFDFLRNILTVYGCMAFVGGIIYLADKDVFKRIHRAFFKYIIWILIIYFLFYRFDGSLVTFASFYILFWRFIPKTRRWLISGAILTLLFFPGQRMPLLRIGLIILLYALYYFRLLRGWRLHVSFGVLMAAPAVFFVLAMTGKYSVFEEMSKDSSLSYGNEALTDDTRTLLYQEALESSVIHDYMWFGRSFSRGYDSMFQTGRAEKGGYSTSFAILERNSEVFIVNIYTWMGIVGAIMFFILFFRASFFAIYKSRNKYMKLLGLCVAVQWVFCWIENCNVTLTEEIFILWAMVAMCLSPYWRGLSDREFEQAIRSSFNYRLCS